MNTHFELLFVCRFDDEKAVDALHCLQSKGYQTQVLNGNEQAPIGSIAIYTGYNEHFPSNVYRVAAHRLASIRPPWAITTPFLVSIKPQSKGNYEAAGLNLATMYTRWYKGEAGVDLPWETRNGKPTSYQTLMEEWMDLVASALGKEELLKILASQKRPSTHKEHGGYIVFNHLASLGRVVVTSDDLPKDLGPNEVYTSLTGFKKPVVSYGTSDLANVFELLQTLKLGHVLGLPVVFETYPSAHNWGWWLNNFLNPSLDILGGKLWSNSFGLNANSRYTTKVSAEKLTQGFKSAQITTLNKFAQECDQLPIWKIYQKAQKDIANRFLKALRIKVEYNQTTTEEICKQNGMWEMNARDLARVLKEAAGHTVNVLNHLANDQEAQIMSSSNIPDKTIEELHKQGYWLGGSALYRMVFSLGNHGGIVVMVKDSTKGHVNLQAREFMTEKSDLYVAPVGLFRLSTPSQNEDWSVDPIVFLEVINRWGPETFAMHAKTIWNAMEVPLNEMHIGRKTTAKITLKGVRIGVTDN